MGAILFGCFMVLAGLLIFGAQARTARRTFLRVGVTGLTDSVERFVHQSCVKKILLSRWRVVFGRWGGSARDIARYVHMFTHLPPPPFLVQPTGAGFLLHVDHKAGLQDRALPTWMVTGIPARASEKNGFGWFGRRLQCYFCWVLHGFGWFGRVLGAIVAGCFGFFTGLAGACADLIGSCFRVLAG